MRSDLIPYLAIIPAATIIAINFLSYAAAIWTSIHKLFYEGKKVRFNSIAK